MSGGSYNKKTINVNETHNNLGQAVINITEDKLRLHLIKHKSSLEDKKSWIAPASLLFTFLTVLTTSTFKDALAIEASAWKAIFVISIILTTVWLVVALIKVYKSYSIDDLVEQIKTNPNPR